MADASVGDVEQLVVLLSAQVGDFEKQLKKASDTATKSYSTMRSGSKTATAAMEADMATSTKAINVALAESSVKIGEFGKAGFAGLLGATVPALAGIIGVESAIEGAKKALEDFDEIGKQAKASGLSAEDFQAYAYAAKLGGVQTDAFSSAMQNFARVSGQAEVGTGRVVAQLKKLDPELLLQIQSATTQKQRLEAVADALNKTSDAAKQAAIAQAFFGDSGGKMVEVLKGGSVALDQVADKARAMGIVVNNELIANAEEMNDKFTTATTILDVQFKEVLVELAPLLVSTANGLAQVAKAVGIIVDQFQDISQRTLINPLENELAATEGTITDLKSHISGLQQWVDQQPDWNPLKALNQNEINASKQLLDQAYATAAQYQDRIDKLQGMGAPAPAGPPDIATGDRAQQLRDYMSSHKGDTGSADADTKAYQRTTAALNLQLQTIGETDRQKQIDNDLSKAHVTASSVEGQAIAKLSGQLYDQQQALAKLNEVYGVANDTFMDFFDTQRQDLANGEGFWQSWADAGKTAIADLLGKVEDMALNAAFQEIWFGNASQSSGAPTSGLGSIVSGILSALPHFVTGTNSAPGGPSIVGENGPEILNVPRGSQVVPAPQTKQLLAPAAASPINVALSPVYNFNGSNLTLSQVKQLMTDNNKQLASSVPAIIADARRRGALR